MRILCPHHVTGYGLCSVAAVLIRIGRYDTFFEHATDLVQTLGPQGYGQVRLLYAVYETSKVRSC